VGGSLRFVYVVYPLGVFLFFFQAEDGIRDRNVTGVQTCALPISTTTPWSTQRRRCATSSTWWERTACCWGRTSRSRWEIRSRWRSEERRVGKECRLRWGRQQERENKILMHCVVAVG